MATSPGTNPAPTTPPPQDPSQAWGKFFIKMGFDVDQNTFKELTQRLTPIQKVIQNFSKDTAYKDSFFAKLPGFSKILKQLEPDTMRAVRANLAFGLASKAGADQGSKFYTNMGLLGKGLVNLVGAFGNVEESAILAGEGIGTGMSIATAGLSLVIALVIQLAVKFKNLMMSAIDYSDKLNEFNRQLGGVGYKQLMKFNDGINMALLNVQKYGFALGEIFSTVSSYVSNGIKASESLNATLIKNTNLLAIVSGESADSISSFFSALWRGSKLTRDSLEDLSNSFVSFNQFVSSTGLAGQLNFSKFKEAIESTGTALLITATKGRNASRLMMADLTSLASLAQTLNIAVGEINSKFEEASNLIGSPDSPFRALLAISGGASFGQMLTNQFNRTDAMLKTADTLKALNAQFGGNLNILGQVAERTFGLSKEVAIKLATLSDENRKAMRLIQQDSIKMHKDATETSYKSLMNTLGNTWERFKNIFITMLQRSVVGNSGIQAVLNRLSNLANNLIDKLGDPDSAVSRFVTKLGSFIQFLFDKLANFIEGIDPIINEWAKKLDNFMKSLGEGTLWQGIKKVLLSLATSMGEAFVEGMKAAFGSLGQDFWLLAMFGPLGLMIKRAITSLSSPGESSSIASKEINPFFINLGKTISQELVKVRQEKSKYEGLKDTDVVVDNHGKLTLAGLEKYAAEDREEALLEAQVQQTKAIGGSIEATGKLIEVLDKLNKEGLKINMVDSSPDMSNSSRTAPRPMQHSPVGANLSYFNSRSSGI